MTEKQTGNCSKAITSFQSWRRCLSLVLMKKRYLISLLANISLLVTTSPLYFYHFNNGGFHRSLFKAILFFFFFTVTRFAVSSHQFIIYVSHLVRIGHPFLQYINCVYTEGKKGCKSADIFSSHLFQKPNVCGEGLSPRITVHCYCFGT